jgi:hypothetical protein
MKKFAFTLVFVVILCQSCDMILGTKRHLIGNWKVDKLDVPHAEIAVDFAKDIIPGVKMAEKIIPDFMKDKILQEIKEKLLNTSIRFDDNGKLDFQLNNISLGENQWTFDEKTKTITFNIKDFKIPVVVEEINEQKMTFCYIYKEEKLRFYLYK